MSIKTALRSTMGNERLTSLALLHLHRDIEINIPQVIDEFARLYPRRMELHDILAVIMYFSVASEGIHLPFIFIFT